MNPLGYIDFSTNVTDGAYPLEVIFQPIINVTITPISYIWEFGDGFRSTSPNPTHTYTIGGTISPTLTVNFQDGSQSFLAKQNLIRIFKVDIEAVLDKGVAPFTTSFSTYIDLPDNTYITSYTWNFADGSVPYTGTNPIHTFVNPSIYNTTLLNGFTGLGFSGVQSYPFTSNIQISATTPTIKYSSMFTCIGWIRNPTLSDQSVIILLAIADTYGSVVNTSASVIFEIGRSGNDYYLAYLGSKSNTIGSSLNIDITDGSWHCVAFECDNNGNMTFYVDGLILSPKSGLNPNGIPYGTASSISDRLGGGPVWAPYLYQLGQSIELYNLRYGKGFNLGQNWISQLIQVDLSYLNS